MTTKPPPHNEEIEQAILGIYLAFPETQKKIENVVTVDDFHARRHFAIYKYIYNYKTLNNEGTVTHALSYLDYLSKQNGALEQCGGYDYVASLPIEVSTSAGLDSLLESLKELSTRRTLITQCSNIITACYDDYTTEIGEILGDMKIALEVSKRNISQEIRDWVVETEGYFSVTDCDKELGIVTKRDKNNRRKVFSRLIKDGIIEKNPHKEGVYRHVLKDCDEIDFFNASSESIDVHWFFGLERFVNTYSKTITVLAGSQDSGKTALLLNLAALNMRNHKVYYFSSEMDGTELKSRLSNFEDVSLNDFKRIKFKDRSRNFADVIEPDGINIIDYLEISDNFFKIGQDLTDIRNKLRGGIAVVALQKEKNAELGRGASFSLEKPRLYLTVDPERPGARLKIVKAKNWKQPEINPNGMSYKFKIVNGCNLRPAGTWEAP